MIQKVINDLLKLKNDLISIEEQRKAKLELFNEFKSNIEKEIANKSNLIRDVQLYVDNIKGKADVLTIILTTKEVMIISYKLKRYRVELPNHERVITKGQIAKYEEIYNLGMNVLIRHNIISNEILEVDFEEVPNSFEIKKRDMSHFKTTEQMSALKKQLDNLKFPTHEIFTKYRLVVYISEKLNITFDVVFNILKIKV